MNRAHGRSLGDRCEDELRASELGKFNGRILRSAGPATQSRTHYLQAIDELGDRRWIAHTSSELASAAAVNRNGSTRTAATP